MTENISSELGYLPVIHLLKYSYNVCNKTVTYIKVNLFSITFKEPVNTVKNTKTLILFKSGLLSYDRQHPWVKSHAFAILPKTFHSILNAGGYLFDQGALSWQRLNAMSARDIGFSDTVCVWMVKLRLSNDVFNVRFRVRFWLKS